VPGRIIDSYQESRSSSVQRSVKDNLTEDRQNTLILCQRLGFPSQSLMQCERAIGIKSFVLG
jgi:hypothetical protein